MKFELQGNQIHLAFQPAGRSRREKLELIYEIIKLIEDLQIRADIGNKD